MSASLAEHQESINPMGTDGFEFVEFASEEPEKLVRLFELLGFVAVGKHRSKSVMHYKQNDINFILNAEPESYASSFTEYHGPCAVAMGFRVNNAPAAFERAVKLGARPYEGPRSAHMELNIPCLYGVGESLLYLIDRYGDHTIYDVDFIPIEGSDEKLKERNMGLKSCDHITHNVERGEMDTWAGFYEKYFNFKEVRFFDIKGEYTGLHSRAMASPCGKIKIPINESKDDQSQIAEYLKIYKGAGIQHIALETDDIYETVERLRAGGMEFMETPDTYYRMVNTRIPKHGEDLERLTKNRILIDGKPDTATGLLLQIFTNTVIGPIFFEIIQRKGNQGFGEGNFQALFESIELDQIERGVIKDA